MSGDFKVFILYFNAVVVVKFGHYFNGSERGVTSAGRVKRRYSDKAVNSVFSLEISVSVFAFDEYGCGFKSRFFTVKPVYELNVVSVSFTPASVHTVEHLRPVLSFCSAGSGME